MELSQLACFVAVSEERSFTRGAKRLDVVQSAASASVARLEHELGVSLLTRTTRSVTPTDAGVAVYRRALQVLVAVQDVRDEVQAFRDGERGTVVVGVVLSTGTIDLAGVLTELQQSQPGIVVQLRFNPGTAETRHEPLLDGTVDLAIVPVSSPTPPEVMVRPIARTSMSLVCRRDDPLARARSVPLTDLRHRPFIDFPEGWGNRAIVDALFARGHVTRDVRVEVADVSTASMLIQQSLGIGFLPSDLPLAGDLAVVDLAHPLPSVVLGLASASRRPLSAVARVVASAIIAHAIDPVILPGAPDDPL